MPNLESAPLTFYKADYFPLSPTYNTWARLTAADVHALKAIPKFTNTHTAEGIYFYLNHPIRWVRLVGVIVAFEAHPNRFVMILDDSSGANIEITCARAQPNNPDRTTTADADDAPSEEKSDMIGKTAKGFTVDLTGVDLGTVVKVKGGIGLFRGERQMTLERLCTCLTDSGISPASKTLWTYER